jgi:hypothetical protein
VSVAKLRPVNAGARDRYFGEAHQVKGKIYEQEGQ